MIHELVPWTDLTRFGVPPMRVIRRSITIGVTTVEVGQQFDPDLLPASIRRLRLRQFYEQHRLEPVDPPPNSRQFRLRHHGLAGTAVIEPITPVASHIVAELPADSPTVDFPSVEIPVAEEGEPKRRKR
jgi:hypothetical protein